MNIDPVESVTLKFGTWNARGLYGKIDRLLEWMEEDDLDFVFITETWWDSRRRDPRCMVANNMQKLVVGTGRLHYGTAIVKNPSRNPRFPFEMVHAGEDGKCQVFRFGGVLFVGCYIPPSQEEDEHWMEVISKWLRARRIGEPVCVLGDLNMRLGAASGDKSRNPRASTIGELLRSHGLTFARNELAEPTCIMGAGNTSIVDYVFYERELMELESYCVSQDEFISDHQPVSVELKCWTKPVAALEYEVWNLSRLQSKDIREQYGKYFEENEAALFKSFAEAPFESQDWLDEVYEAIMNCISRAATVCVGRSSRSKSRIPPLSRRNDILRHSINALRLRVKHGDTSAIPEYEALCAARRELLQCNEEDLHDRWVAFVERFDCLQSNELLKVCRSFKSARQGKNNIGLPIDDASMCSYECITENQFSLPEDSVYIERLPLEFDEEPWIYFTEEEVAYHIWKYPKGKSGGPSGMRMELLKPLNRWIADPLATFFQRCYNLGMVPTAWCRARIVPIPKKPGATDYKDFRPISLTEVVRKIFERCLMAGLPSEIGHADFAQGGFEPCKGTREQVACLNETFRLRSTTAGPPCVAFLDIKTAYDSVDRNVLHNRLVQKGARPHTTRIIMALFDRNRSRVAINGRETREISQRAGLQQGSILSPCLYNLYIGAIQERLRAVNGGDPLTSFWYADDGAVVARDPVTLQRILHEAEAFSKEMNFRFSPTKCEVMNSDVAITIYGQPLPRCTQFKYLGVWFGPGGADWRLHFHKMVEKGRNQLSFWRSIGFNSSGFKLRTRRMVYVTFLRPVVEYCLSISPGVKHITDALESFQSEALRACFSVGKCTSQAAMRALAGVTTFEHRRLELKARFEYPLLNRDHSHMTTVLRDELLKVRRRPLTRTSCFADLGTNPILLWHAERLEQERQVRVMFGTRYAPPRKLEKSILECRAMHLRRDREGCVRTAGLHVDDDCKARYMYSLSRLNPKHSRLVVNWMLGRYVGKPVYCHRCNRRDSSTRHFLECSDATGIDQFCWGKRWRLAMVLLQRIFSAADGYGSFAELLGQALASPNEEVRDDLDRVADEAPLQVYE